MSDDKKENEEALESTIAVIGMSGRFAGSRDVAGFWRNQRDGVESITRYTETELREAGVDPHVLEDPHYVKVGAPLRDMEKFDAGFFGFSPLDASIMDPQHRHFLECSWEAFEDAGHDPAKFSGPIGVWAGSGHNAYFAANVLTHPDLVDQVGMFLLRHTGNDKDFLATRVSYELDLTGPSVNVQTACSTSLVAIHMACQSLLSGECDLALAGGVTIELPHRQGYMYREGEILSPDGHCRVFDAASQGTLFGSGVGAVILRRLEDALEDGDHVLALVRGSAVNNDGASKMGYLAPSVEGQARAVQEALAVAEASPQSVQYIECHGTGTAVGDPIEVAALTEAYRQGTDAKGYCALGSVKPNIGHTDTAAGVASFIKTVEALRHQELPPCLHYSSPNPSIDFENSPFFVNTERREWIPPAGGARRAGVNSLGVGGTNAHVILEEAGPREDSSASRPWQLLLVSARSENALEAVAERLAETLASETAPNLADVAHTLRVGRRRLERRRAVVCRDRLEAAELLENESVAARMTSEAGPVRRSIAFLFPGGGSQYPEMARGLYEAEPIYRESVDDCLQRLEPELASVLKELLLPSQARLAWAEAEFERPSLQLPALFICEMALARLWRSWGIEPDALIGHSMGENTAACLAGVFSLDDALGLVCLRGRLFERVDEGGMLSIPLAAAEVAEGLEASLSIASVNAPELCAASGPIPAIEALETRLLDQGIESRRVKIQIAAHSAMLDPILEDWAAYLSKLTLHPPQIPFVSNLTGTWIQPEQAVDPNYWVQHLRSSVLFADGIETLCHDPGRLFLEVGPGRSLSTLAQMHPERSREQPVLHSLRHPEDDTDDFAHLLATLGRLWTLGVDPDWSAFAANERRVRVSLPTYPWEHQRHWIQPEERPQQEVAGGKLRRIESLDEWFQVGDWKRIPKPEVDPQARSIVVFGGADALTQAVIEAFKKAGHRVWRVRAGDRYSRESEEDLMIRDTEAADYGRLVSTLEAEGALAGEWVHLWHLDGVVSSRPDNASLSATFDPLFLLGRALAQSDPMGPLRLHVFVNGLQEVGGEGVEAPMKSLILGPCRVLPREVPGVHVHSVDLPRVEMSAESIQVACEPIVLETLAIEKAGETAWRGYQRFAPETHVLPLREGQGLQTRKEGAYVITGGLGGLGIVVARYLASFGGARIALLSRGGLPERNDWDSLLASENVGEKTKERIRSVLELEAVGATVEVIGVDVTSETDLKAVLGDLRTRWGSIHGVVHAAGVLEDELMASKDLETAHRVLDPKVKGTLALWSALSPVELDFLWLYSSVSARAGLPGQVDYAAANAFLDAFACQQAARGYPVVSLGWGPWQETGMAAEWLQAASPNAGRVDESIDHPLIQRRIRCTAQEEVFSASLSPESTWILDDHRLATGESLLPGTGFLEMIRAAVAFGGEPRAIEMADVFLVQPLLVPDRSEREVRVVLNRSDGRFAIVSRGADPSWIDHVRGEVRVVDPVPKSAIDLETIRSRCQRERIQFEAPPNRRHLRFGTRWNCLKCVQLGEDEALAELELDVAFGEDCQSLRAHPALLDLATGCAHQLIMGFDEQETFPVPMGYARIHLASALPARVWSHVRYRRPEAATTDVAFFDVTLFDDEGRELALIEDFMLKQVPGDQQLSGSGGVSPEASNIQMFDEASADIEKTGELAEQLKDAIRPSEAQDLFARVLDHQLKGQVQILPHPIDQWIRDRIPLSESEQAIREGEDPVLMADLTESASAILASEGVEQAVVTAHFDRPGERRLLAHIVFESGHPGTVSELRKQLRKQLASDLVPQNFNELTELPRDANGAVNRSALEDPFGLSDDFVAPRTETEKSVARIWQEVLGVDRVGLYDNFFDIGGHSLLAMRVIVRTEKKLGARLNNAIMVLQTLEQVAAEVDKRLGAFEGREDGDQDSAESPRSADQGEQPEASESLSGRFLRAVRRKSGQN